MRTIEPMNAVRGIEWAIVEPATMLTYGLYPDQDMAERICNDLTKRYGSGSYYVAHVEEPTCEMADMWEREDDDGVIWPDGYRCAMCGKFVLGIMPEPGTMVAPKFCPSCGARVTKVTHA